MSGGGFRVSIPNSLRKTIQNLKEITGNHSEEEIYAMLKECSMDPNETAQKLLLQDPFHEVKSKRDKRKESFNNRESAESQWRPGTQGRGSKGGRGNYSARYASHDFGGGKNFAPGKQNGTNQVMKKGGSSSLSSQETKNKEIPSSGPAITNGPTAVTSGNTSAMHGSHITSGSGKVQHEVLPSSVDINTLGSAPSSSDRVLLPSSDPQLPSIASTVKHEVGTHQPPGEQNAVNQSIVAASEVSTVPGKITKKSQGGGKNQLSDSYQPSSATHAGSSLSRPSTNYSNRSQQIIGSQKVSSNKEWKPKPTTSVVAQGPGVTATYEVPIVAVEASSEPQPDSNVLDSEEASAKLQRKLEELYLPPRQHVILPNHIHVPESERNKFTFGSFGANFGLASSYVSGSESDKSSTPVSENSHVVEDTVEEQASSNPNTLATNEEGDFPDQAQSTTPAPENLSPSNDDGDVPASAVTEYNETKQDTASLSGGHQSSVVHTSPHYNFGFVAPMMGTQLAPFENSESQVRDVSRLPGFVVQQPYDPASYYAQFYRPGTESDGRLSPFPSPGVATKYNGNVAVLPPQTSQSPQEGPNSVILTTAGPSPLVTQAAGLMQSSLAMTQQPVPVFRPSPGMHISHYPPNYLPYGHYFSPFYIPPPMHHYLTNTSFPQQPQAGTVYSALPSASASGVKYPLMQYKPGANTGNSITNEDLGGSQFKDNNVYMTVQQAQQVSSFYNVPPPGQHVAFTPTQAGHGTFAGVYHHPAVTAATVHPLLQQPQTMAGAADMAGPTAGAYQQQPQHSQVNWPSNY